MMEQLHQFAYMLCWGKIYANCKGKKQKKKILAGQLITSKFTLTWNQYSNEVVNGKALFFFFRLHLKPQTCVAKIIARKILLTVFFSKFIFFSWNAYYYLFFFGFNWRTISIESYKGLNRTCVYIEKKKINGIDDIAFAFWYVYAHGYVQTWIHLCLYDLFTREI